MQDKKLQVIISLKDEMSNRLKKAGSQFDHLDKQLNKAKIGLLAMAAGTAFAVKKFVELASSAEEIQSKFNTVFSGMDDEMNAWTDDFANNVGRARQDIKAFSAGIADVLKPMGMQTEAAAEMSKQMVELALDVASFNNRQDADVIHSFTSALTGERESLKTLGIVINEADLQQEAYNSGLVKVGETLTKTAKAQATINLLFKNSKDAQGDLERTSESFANQLKAVKARVTNLSEEIGVKLLPTATKLLRKFSDLVEKMKPMAEWIEKNKDMLAALGAVIGGAGGTIFLVKQFVDIIKLLTAALKSLAIMNGINIVGITGLKAALMGLPVAITIAVVLAGFTLVMKQIFALKREINDQIKSEDDLYNMRIDNIRKYGALKKTEDDDVRAYAQAQLEHINNLRLVQDENAEIDLSQSRAKIQATRAVLDEKGKLVLIEGDINSKIDEGTAKLPDLGDAGEAAGKKIADAFEALQKEIVGVNEDIQDILNDMQELEIDQAKDMLNYKQDMAQAYVDQEERVADLKQQISRETDDAERILLQEKLKREEEALAKRKTIEIAFSNDVLDVRRFNNLSDFEQELELINKRKNEKEFELNKKKQELKAELTAKEEQVKALLAKEVEITEDAISEQGKRTDNFIVQANKEIKKAEELASVKGKAYNFGGSPFYSEGYGVSMMANGGIVNRPTLAMIGEDGPEAVIPLKRGLAGVGTGNISINITGNEFVGEEGIADRLGNEIMRAIKDTLKL